MRKYTSRKSCSTPMTFSLDAAKQIARDAVCVPSVDFMDVYDALQPGWSLYNLPNLKEPCWFVAVSQLAPYALQSCTVVIISKANGRVIYCGSANDEG